MPPYPSTPTSASSNRVSNFYDSPKNPFESESRNSNPFADAFAAPSPSPSASSTLDYSRSTSFRDASSQSSPYRDTSYQSSQKKEQSSFSGNPFADAPSQKPFTSDVDSSSLERQRSRNVLSEHISDSSQSKTEKFKGTLKSAFRPLSEMFQKSESKKDEGSALVYDDRSYLYGDDDASSSSFSSSSSSSRSSFLPNPFSRFTSKGGGNTSDAYRFDESDDENRVGGCEDEFILY